MKPSERLGEIMIGLINKDWVAGIGNQISDTGYLDMVMNNPSLRLNYLTKAISQLLDEIFNKLN
jgi:hypothetical protein